MMLDKQDIQRVGIQKGMDVMQHVPHLGVRVQDVQMGWLEEGVGVPVVP
jgi:hypothetical protein